MGGASAHSPMPRYSRTSVPNSRVDLCISTRCSRAWRRCQSSPSCASACLRHRRWTGGSPSRLTTRTQRRPRAKISVAASQPWKLKRWACCGPHSRSSVRRRRPRPPPSRTRLTYCARGDGAASSRASRSLEWVTDPIGRLSARGVHRRAAVPYVTHIARISIRRRRRKGPVSIHAMLHDGVRVRVETDQGLANSLVGDIDVERRRLRPPLLPTHSLEFVHEVHDRAGGKGASAQAVEFRIHEHLPLVVLPIGRSAADALRALVVPDLHRPGVQRAGYARDILLTGDDINNSPQNVVLPVSFEAELGVVDPRIERRAFNRVEILHDLLGLVRNVVVRGADSVRTKRITHF